MSADVLSLRSGSRVRSIRQTEMSECGLACLAMVANFHGCDVDLSVLRRRFPITQRGLALRNLITIADSIGLASRALKLPLEGIGQLALPAVLHWNLRHFVVLESVKSRSAVIHDPARGRIELPIEELSKHFTGVALELRPTANFIPINQRTRLALSSLWSRSRGLTRIITQILALSFLLQLLALAAPYYLQVAVDSALPALDLDLLLLLAIGFGALALVNAGVTLLRSFALLHGGTSLSFQISINIARKLFRLPVSFFERRHIGDILSRFAAIQPIRDGLTQGLAAGVIDGVFVIITVVMMMVYSPLLTGIVVFAFVTYAATRAIFFAVQRRRRRISVLA